MGVIVGEAHVGDVAAMAIVLVAGCLVEEYQKSTLNEHTRAGSC